LISPSSTFLISTAPKGAKVALFSFSGFFEKLWGCNPGYQDQILDLFSFSSILLLVQAKPRFFKSIELPIFVSL